MRATQHFIFSLRPWYFKLSSTMSFSLVFVTLKSVNSYIYSGSWLTESLEILLPVRWAALSQMISGGLMKESCTSAPPLMEVGALRVGRDTNSSVGHFWTNEPKLKILEHIIHLSSSRIRCKQLMLTTSSSQSFGLCLAACSVLTCLLLHFHFLQEVGKICLTLQSECSYKTQSTV